MNDFFKKNKAPIKECWITMMVSWICALIPITFISFLAFILATIASVMSIIVIIKDEVLIGLVQLFLIYNVLVILLLVTYR
ncbi:ABC_6TM_MRP4_D2_like domain containing protein [Burkholderiaceae bacterium]